MKKVLSILLVVVALGGCVATQDGDDSPNANITPALSVEDCFNDAIFYEVGGTNIKFCYIEEWGEPVVHEPVEGVTGKKFSITFSNSDVVAPAIGYYTVDYDKGDSGVPSFDFSIITPYASEDEMETATAESRGVSVEEISLTKVAVGGKRGARVHYEYDGVDELSYYVPDAFEGYNLQISGHYDLAIEIDDMAQLMISF